MHITEIEFEEFPPFGGLNEPLLLCDERVNLLVGPNAYGKSTILRAIHCLNSPTPTDVDVLPWGDNIICICIDESA